MLKKLVSAITYVPRKVVKITTSALVSIRGYFVRPSLDQLIAAETGATFGLFVVFAVYAILALLAANVIWGVLFGLFAGYHLWLTIRMQPWFAKLLIVEHAENELRRGMLATDGLRSAAA